MRKNGFLRQNLLSQDYSLQITSMADVFTILLVFLLKSYAAGTVSLNPSAGMVLPKAYAQELTADALKIEISKGAIQIEGRPIALLQSLELDSKDIRPNGTSKTVADAFEQERKRQLLIAKNNPDVKIDPRLIIISDEQIPYETIKTVLASAALHGFTDFKLAVIRGAP